MLPIERLNKIKSILKERQSIKISELSSLLKVSEMTVHRDLKPLVNDGIVIKTFGGVSLKETKKQIVNNDSCVYCHQHVKTKLAWRLILENGHTETLCCAHCALLRYNDISEQVKQTVCHDFLCHTTINARHAYYVFDTTLNISCCKPQVLTFELKDHAQRFVKGFAGVIHTFEEALELIEEKMDCNT